MLLADRCRQIRVMLSDVDGVLSDGAIWYDIHGTELKRFHIRDGLGIRLWQRAGYEFGIITARSSETVNVRARELGIGIVRQGAADKLQVAQEVLADLQLEPHQACYLGDDLPDLPVIRRVGLGVAVADAALELRASAHHVTALPGGQGAVRETIETILKAQARWDELLQTYLAE
jgi:YrbI family 3-deoxy-D-manno-octulosonate 8-phosphate phosphatase